MKLSELEAVIEKGNAVRHERASANAYRKIMSYAHLFQNPINEVELPADILLDVAGLTPQQQVAIIS